MRRKINYIVYICALIITILLITILTVYASATAKKQTFAYNISAKSCILYEPITGQVLYEQNSNQKLPMASTTKIMTALVVVDKCNLDEIITIGPESVGIEGSSAYLRENDEYTVLELLYALLLQSANDAATALAYYTAGGIEEFSVLMNEKASQLGLKNTHFTNPHGLDDKEHYSTAADLAKAGAELLKNETLKKIVSTYKINFTYGERTRTYINHNKLLQSFDGSIGIKTGFTKRSGRCLVSAAERNGLTLIAVTLDATSDWDEHKKMLEYGFDTMEYVLLCQKGDFQSKLKIVGGNKDEITVSAKDDLFIIKNKDNVKIQKYIKLPRYQIAPIQKGDVIGQVIYKVDKDVFYIDLIAEESVFKYNQTFIEKIIKNRNVG